MCGIVGYVGHQQALPLVLEGLRRLEYRGYDSSGIAVLGGAADGTGLVLEKRAGRIENLDKALATEHPDGIAGTTGLGHTRWATHGAPTDRNAHPHLDAAQTVAIVHNGIIENFAPLRAELEAAGVELRSETDSEVVAHLLAAALPDTDRRGRPGRGHAGGLPAAARRLHAGRRAPGPPRGDGGRAPQLAAGGGRRER